MTKSQFLVYIEDLNSGDIERVLPYYDADIVFENFGRHQQGAEAIQFLRQLHRTVENHMAVRHILIDEDLIAMEADTTLRALVDLPHLPIGALAKDQKATVRTFSIYETRGDRIVCIRVAGWPPIISA